MMQKKLTEDQREKCRIAWKSVHEAFRWSESSQGLEYWEGVAEALAGMAEHGTSDGKPWVEPPLTDEDAKERPWVMVRDTSSQPWCGPKVLAYVEKDAAGPREYLDTAGVWWHYARKAKAEEIPARKATQ
jgi:hypothetical protein